MKLVGKKMAGAAHGTPEAVHSNEVLVHIEKGFVKLSPSLVTSCGFKDHKVAFAYDEDNNQVFLYVDDETGIKIWENGRIETKWHVWELKMRFKGENQSEPFMLTLDTEASGTEEHPGINFYRLRLAETSEVISTANTTNSVSAV